MAKAKKEAALTPEERLQAALVPDWEWPYKLPENWCWTTVGAINQYVGSSIDPMKSINECFELYSVPSSAENYPEVVFGAEIGSTKQAVEKGDVLLCKINPRINRVWKVSKHTEHTLLASSEWIVVRNSKFLSDYLMWCFRSQYFREYMLSNVSGVGGSLMRAQPKYVQGYPIPVPPLTEQQRIVDRIENLFAKLDESKEKAQIVVDSFETRKAAILYKAFTGELTANWREAHGVGMESWEKHTVDDLCHSLKYGTAKKSDTSGTVVVIRMGNLQQGEIDWSDLAYSNDDDDIEKYKLYPGDVLFNRTNSAALVGKTSIYRGEYPAIYAGYLIKLDYDHEQIIGDYLNYALNTLDAKEYCNSVKTDGVNQSNINAKKIGAYSFSVPSVPEQKEIVGVVQRLLLKEKQAKEAAEAVLDQIDLMKKSILARAFRGELGTNDPTDEPAVELIKSVFQQKIAQESKPKKQEKKGNHKEENIVAKTILEVLAVQKKATPEALKKDAELDIDDFYDQVKALIASKVITETREGNEVFLEVTHADRQANN